MELNTLQGNVATYTRCGGILNNHFTAHLSPRGVNDIADAVAMHKEKNIKRYSLNSSVVCDCEICSLIVK